MPEAPAEFFSDLLKIEAEEEASSCKSDVKLIN